MKKNIALLLAPGFEEIEAATPIDVLRRFDMNVQVLGISSTDVEGAHGLVYKADALLEDHAGDHWDALVLPGGAPGAWNLKDDPLVEEVVKRCHEENIVIAALCAAPIVLAKAGIVKGRNVTAYPAPPVDEDMKESINTRKLVERDGNVITGKGPGAAMEFSFLLAEALGVQKAELEAMRQEMIIE